MNHRIATKPLSLLALSIILLLSCDIDTTNPGEKKNPDAPPIDPTVVDSKDVPEGYVLVWNDEFNRTGLPDADKWSYDTALNFIGWGNGEKQFYTANRLENANVYGGKLHIIARLEQNSEEVYGTEYNYDYTSARLNSYPNSRTYGFIEVRAKIPGGAGTWPAIWMVGLGYWPDCGEIDIMEQWGNDTVIGGNFHVKKFQGITELIKHYAPADLFSTFHNYQLLWTQDKLTVMVDGVEVNAYEKDLSLTGQESHDQWPFNESENLILNLAIQGKGVYVDESIFPVDFQIDYVRWYQQQ